MRSESPVDATAAQFFELTSGFWVSQALSVVATLGVADELADGPRPVDEIAKHVGADGAALYRLLRSLVDVGVFRELEGRRFGLTDLGELLQSDVPGSMRDWAAYVGLPFFRDAWTALLESVRTGAPGLECATGQSGFDYLREHPADAAAFDAAMTAVSNRITVPVVVGSYDFGSFGTVVDVGGGQGRLLAAVLKANPTVRGILYDRPEAVAGAAPVLQRAGVADRCEAVGGDFFAWVPPGADAYLLSRVIHDWDDESAVRILANCREAMSGDGRVLLAEAVIPDGITPSPAKIADLQMLVMTRGRERTEAEYVDLVQRAGLRFSRTVWSPFACIVEAFSPDR